MDKMTDIQFIEALNDCIDRMNDGQSLQSCLAAYPDYAEQLESLLQTGELVYQATYEEDQVSAAKERTLQRINTTMRENRNGAKKQKQPRRYGWFMGVAGIVLVIFGILLVLNVLGQQSAGSFIYTLFDSDGSLPIDQPQPQATRLLELNATTEMQLQATQVAAAGPTVTKTPFGGGSQGGAVLPTGTPFSAGSNEGGASAQAAATQVNEGSGGIVGIPSTGTAVANIPTVTAEPLSAQITAASIDPNAVGMTATNLANILQAPTLEGTMVVGGPATTALPDTGGGAASTSEPTQVMQVQPTNLPTQSVSATPAMTATAMPQGTPVAMTTFLPTATVTATVTATPTLAPPSRTPIPSPTVSVDTLLRLPEEEFLARYGVNPFTFTADDNLSTFSMDVDTASYTLTRNYLRDFGQFPPQESIRPEEFINFFDADYDPPINPDEAFAIHLDAAPAPFGIEGDYLMRVGIQGRQIAPEDRDPALLIFVIDVSGSMDSPQKLGLVKDSLRLLVDELGEDDRVGIVIYASNTQPILNPTPASEKATIMAAIDSLQANGSTYAEAGLRLGYSMAEANMRQGETTRIILLSDGVANVGETGPDAILEKVNEGVEAGITLSTIGFGMGGFNDYLMEQLANDGNGNYFYIDNIREARRIFVNNLTSTLQVIGYDAKIQVEFAPEITERYRLIGYENRAVADVDFRNDTVDAGEVGAGHSITALYEIGLFSDDPNQVIATVYIRYQDAETREIVEISRTITTGDLLDDIRDAPPSFRLQAGVAEFAELLRGSIWAQDGSFSRVLELVQPLENDYGGNPQIMELVELIRLAIQYGGR